MQQKQEQQEKPS